MNKNTLPILLSLFGLLMMSCLERTELIVDRIENAEKPAPENVVARELLVRDLHWENNPLTPGERVSFVFHEENAQILRDRSVGGPKSFGRWQIAGDTLLLWKEKASPFLDECYRIGYSPQTVDPDTGVVCTRDTLYITPCAENNWDTLVHNCRPGM